ncbi:synapse-associated protein of 47 kDa isoform X2 [Contarinia nasturtii]|uniref:synapse-associated protein of 47 kDa isoform X2 n=1 Tax=Contarinia nasturtii TaxID=265458 RepID=UPI0012D3856B|nr:synapse-associated protein of 47 kDa isoform X2 [Contarinia nasturtii]
MFSGLTNQVSSWMGAVKGENEGGDPAAQENVDPVQSEIAADAGEHSFENVPVGEEGEAAAISPTKAGVFSNVQSKVSGWLPAMPTMSMPAMPNVTLPTVGLPNMPNIPGLKKNSTSADAEGAVEAAENVENATGAGDDDEDRSSATEGADSRPASGPGTPTDEKGGQVGIVTTKVTQGAKNFGSFLYSAVNKASSKIKETVKDNNILGEFNKEQEEFIKSQQGGIQSGVVPWAGHQNEEKVKEEIFGLSSDRRNFVRAPPSGVDFEFNYDLSYPTAVAIMAEDTQLEKMRFDLVPKIITEEQFWRNYFYRVSLICQASDLGTLGAQGSENEANKSEENSAKPLNKQSKSAVESEFVSDAFQTTDKDLDEVKAGMKLLGIDSLTNQSNKNDEEQWEKELDNELQEFELVDNGGASNADDANQGDDWEKDADGLLDDEDEEDLK